jgi:hypothetical protein
MICANFRAVDREIEADLRVDAHKFNGKLAIPMLAGHLAGDEDAVNRSLTMDDCETTATLVKKVASTIERAEMSAGKFEEMSRKCGLFSSWNMGDWEKCAAFYTRMQGLFRSGALFCSWLVGLRHDAVQVGRVDNAARDWSCRRSECRSEPVYQREWGRC